MTRPSSAWFWPSLLMGLMLAGGAAAKGGNPPPGGTNPLPDHPPAPDILMRESFGPGPDFVRPKGGKGDLRSSGLYETLGGFWIEWPGSKNNAWKTPNGDQSWKFAGAGGNPYELPSPLQPDESTMGVAYANNFDVPPGTEIYPTALVAIQPPVTPWAVSIEAVPIQDLDRPNSYVALGLTRDGKLLLSNFTTVGLATVILRPEPDSPTGQLRWDLRIGGASQAQGLTDDWTYNHLELRIDPSAGQLWAGINGSFVGPYAAPTGPISFAGFEGKGMADNFVMRRLDVAAP